MKTVTITLPIEDAEGFLAVYALGWEEQHALIQDNENLDYLDEDVAGWKQELEQANRAERIIREALKEAEGK